MNQTSMGTSNASLNSKLTRTDRNQRTLDGIKDSTRKMKTELNQLQKDIYDNVLEYHVTPGALNQTSINFALKTRLWDKSRTEMSGKKILPKAKGPPMRATKEQIQRAEEGFEDISEQCAKLTQFGRIDRTTVRE